MKGAGVVCFNVLLFLSLFVLSSLVQADPCDLPSTGNTWFGFPTSLKSCYESIPFNRSIADETLEAIKVVIDTYSFTDIAVNSKQTGSSYDIRVDLWSDFNRVSTNVASGLYTSDFSFHLDCAKMFLPLLDAHTQYQMPQGYFSVLVRPFSLKAELTADEKNMRILLAPSHYEELFLNVLSFNATPYYGQEIVNINGEEALASLMAFAQEFVGYYKDIEVRMNALFEQGGPWEIISVQRFGFLPYLDKDVITLATGEIISSPIYSISGIGNMSRAAIMDKNNAIHNSLESQRPEAISSDPHTERRREMELIRTLVFPEQKRVDLKSVCSLDPIYQSTDNNVIYMVLGNTVPILKISTFLPDPSGNSSSVLHRNFTDTIQLAYSHWRNHNFTDLIIDVSGNGGGEVCLALDLLTSLITEWKDYNTNYTSVVWGLYDLRKSTTLDIEMNSAYGPAYYSNSYANPQTRQHWAGQEWYTPGRTYTRGGKLGHYTEQSYFPWYCGNPQSTEWPASTIPFIGSQLNKLLIVTDGKCGSACSLFTTQLKQHKKAYVLSHGGIKAPTYESQMETSSFAGGNVLEYSELAELLTALGVDPLPIKQLPTSAILRFNSHEYYANQDSQIPREFVKIPADQHYFSWDALWNNQIFYPGTSTLNDASCIPLERFYSSITTIFPVIPDGLPNHIGPFDPTPSPVPSPVANQPTTPTPTPTPTPQNQPSAAPLPSEQPANGVAPEPPSPSNEPSVQPYPGPQAAQYPVWYMPVNWALVGFGGVVIVAALIALCLQRNQKITTRKIPAIMEFE